MRLIEAGYTNLVERRMSFLGGDAGLLALGIVVCNAAPDKRDLRSTLLGRYVNIYTTTQRLLIKIHNFIFTETISTMIYSAD